MRLSLSNAGWLALITAAFLAPTAASAATPEVVAADPVAPVHDLHLRFFLVPGDEGSRMLVLRDDRDLELPMGEVKAGWACDSGVEIESYVGDRELQVGCGGGALKAAVDLSYEHFAAPSLSASSTTGASYDLPYDHGAKLWLDPKLVEPAADPGDASLVPEVVVSVDESRVERRYEEWIEQFTHLGIHSTVFPLDASVEGTAAETCSTQVDAAGTELNVTCSFRDQPHADVVDLRVRDGALLWRNISTSTCAGSETVLGGWRLPRGTRVWWPEGATVVEAGDPDWVRIGAPSEGPYGGYVVIEYRR
jgi:hypothetical protein